MYVVTIADTGYSDESMRFATRQEMDEYVCEYLEETGIAFTVRYEV